jgi:hypothetical protein
MRAGKRVPYIGTGTVSVSVVHPDPNGSAFWLAGARSGSRRGKDPPPPPPPKKKKKKGKKGMTFSEIRSLNFFNEDCFGFFRLFSVRYFIQHS